MPVTVKVNGTANSLVHKGSNGISMATIPDVCKTPSPAGPVPIPYPNISQSATLDKGTTTVKADGGMMIATKGSEFSLSNGDNAGVAGGVKSSTFMKESTWILYSFDVKMDGSNACRLTDKKFQNHENTADMGGCTQLPVIPIMDDPEAMVACAIWCCDHATYDQIKRDSPEKDCQRLASKKHSCVHHSLKNTGDERLASSPRFTADGEKFKVSEELLADRYVRPDRGPPKNPYMCPDVVVLGPPAKIIDAKFIPCHDAGEINSQLGRSDGRIVMNNQSLTTAVGDVPKGPKETKIYPKMEVDGKPIGKDNVRTMTPDQAEEDKTEACTCETPPA